MSALVKILLDNGTSVLVEADDTTEDGSGRRKIARSGDGTITVAASAIEQAFIRVRPLLENIRKELQTFEADEYEVDFGLKLSVGAFWFIASGEANFNVKMTWKR